MKNINDSYMKHFFVIIKNYKYMTFLFLTSALEICRGFILTYGVALGVKNITDGCVQSNFSLLQSGILVFSISIVVAVVLVYLVNRTLSYKKIEMAKKLRIDVINICMFDHYDEINAYSKDDILYRLNNNIGNVVGLYGSTQSFFGSFGKLAGSFVAGFTFSWHLTIVLLGYGVIRIIFDKVVFGKLQHKHKEQNKLNSNIFSSIIQIIQGIFYFRLSGNRIKINHNFTSEIEQYNNISKQLNKTHINIDTLNQIIDIVALFSVFVIGAVLSYNNIITIGVFVAFISMYDNLINPYKFIGNYIKEVSVNKIGCEAIFELLQIQKNVMINELEKNLQDEKFEVISNKITFSYNENNNILCDFSFTANSGEITYIVGKSGVGKSTLFKILSGLIDNYSGEFSIRFLNKNQIVPFNNSDVTYISQTPFLFNATIAENIALTTGESIDWDKLKTAVDRAGLEKLIETFPGKYDYILVDKGKNLSGGQKALISLARTFYNPTPIILLDEIYASLDNITIQKVDESLHWLCNQNFCILFISHRKEWIPDTSKIIELRGRENVH